MFAGRNALFFDIAQQCGRTYISPADGLSRFEISDRDAQLRPATLRQIEQVKGNGQRLTPTLGQLLQHAELFRHYPELQHVETLITRGHNETAEVSRARIRLELTRESSPARILSVTLHEVQHYIQMIEGFSAGGSPAHQFGLLCAQKKERYEKARHLANKHANPAAATRLNELLRELAVARPAAAWLERGFKMPASASPLTRHLYQLARGYYRALPGEVEASDVQHRQFMSYAERLLTPPANAQQALHRFSTQAVYFSPRQGEHSPEARKALHNLGRARKRLSGTAYPVPQKA